MGVAYKRQYILGYFGTYTLIRKRFLPARQLSVDRFSFKCGKKFYKLSLSLKKALFPFR